MSGGAGGAAGAVGSALSLADWVASRTPPAPDALKAHMMRCIEQGSVPAGVSHADALVHTCNSAFTRVLASGATCRDSALDLLSADAFVTYAFEVAADEPETIAARAGAAMRQVSDLARAQLAQETT